jgi:RimJ/RimL family protein N-acetyltransferase
MNRNRHVSGVEGSRPVVNIRLRPIERADALAVAVAVDQSRDALRRWMPWYHDAYDVRDAVAWIDASVVAASTSRGMQFAILGDADAFLGVVGIEGLDNETGRAMIGYWLATPVTGRGVGRQAIALALDWARANPSFRLVWALVAEANVASQRVLEANRFQRVGSRGIDDRGDVALLYELELRSAERPGT